MARFLTTFQAELVKDDPMTWRLVKPLVYTSDIPQVHAIIVPVDFVTNLASVPRVPIFFDIFGGVANQAAVLHDRLYCTHEVDRKIADSVLREAAIVSGVPRWKAYSMWAAVRIFGQAYWDEP